MQTRTLPTKPETNRAPIQQCPIGLIILDGFGYNHSENHNAITAQTAPFFFSLLKQYPHTLLHASGKYVGLPAGFIGNSEVGHMTIGAGRVIEQPAAGITRMIDSGEIFSNRLLNRNFTRLKTTGGRLHLMGLLSDAGAHSLEYHVIALFEAAIRQGITDILIHPFLDGRDVPPKSAALYLARLEAIIKKFKVGTIASLHGRFYAMDRDQEWDRTLKSYVTLTQRQEQKFSHWSRALEHSYAEGITDEFFVPVQLGENSFIEPLDGIIFFNFREDRARQITLALLQPHFSPFKTVGRAGAWMITAIEYMPDLPVGVLYKKKQITNTLFDVLEQHNKSIFSIAETEKYAHITYFFNGGNETTHLNETRILIPSLDVPTYAQSPEMSALKITDAVIDSLQTSMHDFYLINYANADMVGHSGDFQATCKALSCIDEQIKKLYQAFTRKHDGTLFITGDHGKAENMWDQNSQQPRTAHTNNPVYFIQISKNALNQPRILPLNQLANVAPLILQYMGIPIPHEMHKESSGLQEAP